MNLKYEIISEEKPKVMVYENEKWTIEKYLEDIETKPINFGLYNKLISIVGIGEPKVLLDNLTQIQANRLLKKLNKSSKNYYHFYRLQITPNIVVKLRKDYETFKKGEVFQVKNWNFLEDYIDVWNQVEKNVYKTIIPKKMLDIIEN